MVNDSVVQWHRPARGSGGPPAAGDPQTLAALIGAVYESAMDAVPWQRALDELKRLLGGRYAALRLQPGAPRSTGVAINTDVAAARAACGYETHFFALDPFLHLADGEVTTPEDLLGEGWCAHPVYREFLRPLDVGAILAVNLYTDDGTEVWLRVSRPYGAPPYGAAERELLRRLLPHWRRALTLHARLDSLDCERQVLAGTMQRIPLGMIALARDGALLGTNEEALRILAADDGLYHADGRLDAGDAQTALQALLERAAAQRAAGAPAIVDALRLPRRSGRAGYVLVAHALSLRDTADGTTRPALVLFVRDPESPLPSSDGEALRRRFGFTRTEAGLALSLAQGCTLGEAAERLDVSADAARAALRAALAKTGLRRQAALAQLVLGATLSLNDRTGFAQSRVPYVSG